MLGEDDRQDVRNLVAKADKLWALHGQKNSLIASVDQPEEETSAIAAVGAARGRGGSGGRSNHSNRGQQLVSRGNQPQSGSQQPLQQQSSSGTLGATAIIPSNLARMSSDLCFFHRSWGDKARNCVAPCGWQGN